MALADEIIPPAIFKHIFCKQRLGIVSHNAGLKAVVCGLDITVTVIDSYDQFFFELFHNDFPQLSPRLSGVSFCWITAECGSSYH